MNLDDRFEDAAFDGWLSGNQVGRGILGVEVQLKSIGDDCELAKYKWWHRNDCIEMIFQRRHHMYGDELMMEKKTSNMGTHTFIS